MKLFFNYFLKTIFSLFIIIQNSFGQIPNGYYNNAKNLTGQELKSALNNIIKRHTKYPYTNSSTDVWDILKEADRDPNNSNNVIGIYSNFSMDAMAEYAGGSGWSREHVWAQSRGNFDRSHDAGTDTHHIRACDISTNSARSNRNFDYGDFNYVDKSGTYKGSTDSKTSNSNFVWEPRDEVKGDVARMIFYMATRYEGNNGEPDLELTENHLSNGDQSPLHSKLSVLLEWHLMDIVSDEERRRNDIIYGFQNNRNPFIDHPEYVCKIYNCNIVNTVTSLIDNGLKTDFSVNLYPNPSENTIKLDIKLIKTQTIWVEVLNMKGQIFYSSNKIKTNLYEKILDVEALENGFYVLKIYSNSGVQMTKKFVVIK